VRQNWKRTGNGKAARSGNETPKKDGLRFQRTNQRKTMPEQPTTTDLTATKPAPAVNSSTVPKQLKPFVKGDTRINRKGRPKSFEELRRRVLTFLAEQGDEASGTRLDAILLELAASDPKTLLEYGFGKVPSAVELTGTTGAPVIQVVAIDASKV
jgi:hypothetical protein